MAESVEKAPVYNFKKKKINSLYSSVLLSELEGIGPVDNIPYTD